MELKKKLGRKPTKDEVAKLGAVRQATVMEPGMKFAVSIPPGTTLTEARLRRRAEHFNSCNRRREPGWPEHFVDAVISPKYSFMFVDNVKAGSATVRKRLQAALKVSMAYTPQCAAPYPKITSSTRTKTNCITTAEAENISRWSVVRNPVAKFESGVREAWHQNPGLARFSADEILALQLCLIYKSRTQGLGFWKGTRGDGDYDDSDPCWAPTLTEAEFSAAAGRWLSSLLSKGRCGWDSHCGWLDEHLQPNLYRLEGSYHGAAPARPRFDFIGQLETMDTDWPAMVKAGINPIHEGGGRKWRSAWLRSRAHSNMDTAPQTTRLGPTALRGSPTRRSGGCAGRRRMGPSSNASAIRCRPPAGIRTWGWAKVPPLIPRLMSTGLG